MTATFCADAHPAWVAFVTALEAPGFLRGRQRSCAFVDAVREVGRLVITYHGIRPQDRERACPELAAEGRVPFVFPRQAIARIVRLGDWTVYRALDVLERLGLIARVGELRRRCHTPYRSQSPGSNGAWWCPLTYAIGARFEGFFGCRTGTELADTPAENHSAQERLPQDSESRTDSSVLHSETILGDSIPAPHLLCALTSGQVKKPEVVDDVSAKIRAELALLREAQAEASAKAKLRAQSGRAWSIFSLRGSGLG